MRLLSALICAIALGVAAPHTSVAADRALVIGINSYPGITLAGQPGARNLRGAVLDAEHFAAFLESDFGFTKDDVKILTDAQATRAAIVDAFETWLIKDTGPGDRVVFFYAGHGTQTIDRDGDEPDGDKFDEALAPADTAGELGVAPLELANLLLDDELGKLVERLAGRDVMVVVDACNSGTITRGLDRTAPRDPDIRVRTLTPRSPAVTARGILDLSDDVRRAHKVNTRLIDVEPKGATAIWTATASSQLAFDTVNGGFFTQALLEGIDTAAADHNRDGAITVVELLNYVRRKSEEKCVSLPNICRHGLTPTLEANATYLDQIIFPLAGRPDTGSAVAIDDPAANGTAAEKKATAYFSHENDFGLKIEILPGARPKLGSEVKFRVTSSKAGHLLLLDKSPDGSFTQIFPNRFSAQHGKSARIAAGATLTVPDASYGFAFEATDRGTSTLIGLVVEDIAAVEDILSQHLDLETLDDPAKLISALAAQLYRPLETKLDAEPNRRMRWAYATETYVVE